MCATPWSLPAMCSATTSLRESSHPTELGRLNIRREICGSDGRSGVSQAAGPEGRGPGPRADAVRQAREPALLPGQVPHRGTSRAPVRNAVLDSRTGNYRTQATASHAFTRPCAQWVPVSGILSAVDSTVSRTEVLPVPAGELQARAATAATIGEAIEVPLPTSYP